MRAPPRHPCPVCGRPAAAPRVPGRPANAGDTPAPPAPVSCFPFCSPACRLVDLGRWLDGSYRVPDQGGSPWQDREAGDGE